MKYLQFKYTNKLKIITYSMNRTPPRKTIENKRTNLTNKLKALRTRFAEIIGYVVDGQVPITLSHIYFLRNFKKMLKKVMAEIKALNNGPSAPQKRRRNNNNNMSGGSSKSRRVLRF